MTEFNSTLLDIIVSTSILMVVFTLVVNYIQKKDKDFFNK